MRMIDNIRSEGLHAGLIAALLSACAVNALLLWAWL